MADVGPVVPPHVSQNSRRSRAAGLLGSAAIGPGERLARRRRRAVRTTRGAQRDRRQDPPGHQPGRPITRVTSSLDMPAAAEDGRVVPLIIESDLPMTADRYVKAVHLVVDFNPDAHSAVYELRRPSGRCRSRPGSR
jgi:hypothetical protein